MHRQSIAKWLAVLGVAFWAASCVEQQLSQEQLATQAYLKDDYDAAFRYMQPLLAANDPVTLRRLGYMYRHGLGVEKNYEKSLHYECRAALAGEWASFGGIGFMFSEGLGVPQDDSEAFRWYIKAAELGSSGSQYNLGQSYFYGEGTARDLVRAHKWLTLAHNRSNEIDHKALRLINEAEEEMTNQQVAEALERAKAWKPEKFTDADKAMVRKSQICSQALNLKVERPLPNAKFFQLTIKSYGADNFDASVSDLSPAAENGDRRAQFVLAHMYHQGYGVAQNQGMAIQWYCRAAVRGQPDAMYWTGHMHENGDGVLRDKDLAKAWYELSAQLGNPFAQLKLGQGYLRGGLVEKDPGQAYLWLSMAVGHSFEGRDAALEMLDEARDLLPQDLKKAAIHEAADWEPSDFDDQIAAQVSASQACSGI